MRPEQGLNTTDDFKRFGDRVREVTGGIPIGMKLSAQHIEEDMGFVDAASQRLATFFEASTELMQVMARACGHDHLSKLEKRDLATWDDQMAKLTGIRYSGFMTP